MTLVGWDVICQPRLRGGFTIQHLGDHNSTFMVKLGFNFVTKTDDL